MVGAIENALKNHGYRAICFTNPLKAMLELKNNNQECVLVISDILMSDMDGIEFARNVKEARHDMPLVLDCV